MIKYLPAGIKPYCQVKKNLRNCYYTNLIHINYETCKYILEFEEKVDDPIYFHKIQTLTIEL